MIGKPETIALKIEEQWKQVTKAREGGWKVLGVPVARSLLASKITLSQSQEVLVPERITCKFDDESNHSASCVVSLDMEVSCSGICTS
jgi:hypothetical protein